MSRGIALPASAVPTPPPAGYKRLFVDVGDGNFYVQSSDGSTQVLGGIGPTGKGVLSGAVAPTTEGTDGDFYIDTVTSTFYGPKAAGVWPAGVSLIGPTGAIGDDGYDGPPGEDGFDGNTILYGAVAPTTEGVDGNFYIDTATSMFYGPKAAGVWPAGVSLIGADGAAGAAGADGAAGVGVPVGGTTGQALVKIDAADYNTQWATIATAAQGDLADSAVQPGDPVSINAQTGTTYAYVLTDAGKLVTHANAGAITGTVPTNATVAYAVGTVIALQQMGVGALTVVGATGVTINGVTPGSVALTDAQYKTTAALTKHATDTWTLTGAVP